MEVAEQARTSLIGEAKAESKKVVFILKTTPRQLAVALHYLRTSPISSAPDACALEPARTW